MKKIYTTIILSSMVLFTIAQETIVFHEGFEGGVKPNGWTQQRVKGLNGSSTTVSWQYLEGGYGYDPADPNDRGYPDHAAQGSYNAMFQLESYNGEATKLITPPLDLSDVLKPELRFAHAQATWYFNDTEYNDILKIYYKRGADSAWVLMENYGEAVENWTNRSILLPDSSLSSTYYIAFEGITGFGYGTCIDTVRIVETGVIAKYLNSYSIQQASTDFIPTNTTNNPILKIVMDVQGNDGTLFLDSLKVSSLNSDDNNLSTDGIKLYATNDSTFKDPLLLKGGGNFNNGNAWFKNINYDLPRGVTTLWITYDIAEAADHDIHNNIVDAKIEAEGIYINGSAFPFADKSPDGERLLKEAIFNETFETDQGWILNGSFERTAPQGLGGSPGYPDPEVAYNGVNVLGTDLTIDGEYSKGLANRQDSAVSPTFDCFYYKDVTLYFARWLNISFFHNAYIDLSTDNGTNWSQLWKNISAHNENSWIIKTYDLDNADFKEEVKLRFALGTTDNNDPWTGWNIDDFILIGDFISKDVGITGITKPETSCGHTTSDDISVYIENYAGEATPTSVPVRYEIDNSGSYITDAHLSSIPVGDSTLFTFSVKADLSTPGFHTIDVETILSGDEMPGNNSMTKTIFSYPTYTLPYYENFETNNGYYLPGGNEFSTWEYGTPAGTIINSAASGTHAWVTDLNGTYLNNDSSFIESPCFNFAGSDSIVFEFRATVAAEDQTDGLALLYSLDEGLSWDIVPNDNDFYWNWYNEESLSASELPGIDTTDGTWLTFRQLLPPDVSNQSSVKFRFLFESNGSFKYEGVGIDNVKIYDAPHDVGVSSIVEPYTACEWSDSTLVKVIIENFGIDTLDPGIKVPVGLDFQGSYYTTDTLTLASSLAPNGTVEFTFSETINMSDTGNYKLDVYTLLESDPYFYNETVCNDSISDTIRVDGMPNYDIGWIVGSDDLDTLLDAGAGYDTYFWDGPVEDSTTQTYRASAEAIYYVTVTRTNELYCEAYDSLKVVQSTIDLKMDSIRTVLKDSCQRFELTEIRAAISNLGQHFIDEVNDTILFGYQVNNLPEVHDTLFLDGRDLTTTAPYDTISFTFGQKCDLTEIGEYTIRVFTNFEQDLNRLNDADTVTINTFGMPDVELAYDTIYSSQADTLTLDAGPGFASYLWNPGDSTTQTITPKNSSYYYYVTVTDVNGCGSDTDSTYIETHDLGVTFISSPDSICADLASATTPLNIEITNYSDSTYNAADLKVYYEYDGGAPQEINTTLTVGGYNTVTLNGLSTIDVTSVGKHTLKVYTSSAIDVKNTNDTIEYTFETYPLPDVDLAYDTIFTTKADTVELIAQPGFATYNWNSGSTNDTLTVTKKYSYNYIVTVTDINGCGNDTDTTQLITYNVGINELVYPLSACEHKINEKVIVAVKNYSYDTLKAGTVIPVGFKLNGGTTINENFTLSSKLDPQKTVNYTFNSRVDLSSSDTYRFDLFTGYKFDVVPTNDTLVDVIKTFGFPNIDLGDDIYTTQPDTVILVADPGYRGYFWNDGTNNDSLIVSYPASKQYSVDVNDINGCISSDTIEVITYDVGIASINSPQTTCEFTATETVKATVINNSQDTLLSGELIDINYSLNGGAAVNETLELSENLLPGSTVDYSFTATANLSSASNHSIKVTVARTIDVNDVNDTLSVNINEVGYPSFDLGDNILTTTPVGTVIAGPTGYDSYEWQDGSSTTDYTISYPATRQYALTVTDTYGCEGSDSLFVYTYDVAPSALNTPVSACVLSSTETVNLDVVNNSQDTLLIGDQINVSYALNSGSPVSESFVLTDSLKPGETVSYTFTQPADLSANQEHQFDLSAERNTIDVETNDDISTTVDYLTPIYDLGGPVTEGGTEYIIHAGPGYTNYKWFDGTESPADSTYTVDINAQKPNNYYAVTVTTTDGCEVTDSIKVTFTTTADLSVTNMLSPTESKCWNSAEEDSVHIEITNVGIVNLTPGTSFTIGYLVNNGNKVTETFNLSTAMNANDTREYVFDKFTYSSAGNYKFKPFVTLSNDGDASNDTLTTTNTIAISQPEVDFVGQSDTIYFDEGDSYTIQLNGTYLSYAWSTGETSASITVTNQGGYTVTVTDQYTCQAQGTFWCLFNEDTGLDNIISGDGYSLTYYPNPTSDKVMIAFDNIKPTDVRVEIVTMNGQVIYTNELKRIKTYLESVDVNAYANGIYYMRFRINGDYYSRKLIVQ